LLVDLTDAKCTLQKMPSADLKPAGQPPNPRDQRFVWQKGHVMRQAGWCRYSRGPHTAIRLRRDGATNPVLAIMCSVIGSLPGSLFGAFSQTVVERVR
jgi:hypothetical protein